MAPPVGWPMDLVDFAKEVVEPRRDDDLNDRFNHTYTSMLLVLFAIVVTTEQYVGAPIKCWTPAQFTTSFETYTHHICWVENTYSIPAPRPIPDGPADKPQVRYYQWTPFIFLTFALLYRLPSLLWRANSDTSGLNLQNIIEIGDKYHAESEKDTKEEQIKLITLHFARYFEMKQRWDHCKPRVPTLTFWYLTAKLLYLLNVLAQFVCTDLMLSSGRMSFYGLALARNFITGVKSESDFFPRETLCDFRIREMGREVMGARYTVQCVLTINLYLEAIFTFYWFWLSLLILLNLWNLYRWMLQTLLPHETRSYVARNIRPELKADLQHGHDDILNLFINNQLQSDGVFALRLISRNVSDIVTRDVISALFENYKIAKLGAD